MKKKINGKTKWVCKCGVVFSRRGSYLFHRQMAHDGKHARILQRISKGKKL